MTHRLLQRLLCAVCGLSIVIFCGCTDKTAQEPDSGERPETPSDTDSGLLDEIELLRNECIAQDMETADLQSLLSDHLQKQESAETEPASSEAPQREIPDSYRIEGVPEIAQLPDFPTGCESVSAVMLLQYAGEELSVSAFIDQYLDRSDHFYHMNGLCYGPDPSACFIGDPRTETSYGCMATVIEKAFLRFFGSDERYVNTTGLTLPVLCEEYISCGIPVMVWVSLKMEAPIPGSTWHLSDGSSYQWLANEHCMVLIGYDEQYYYFNDPYTGTCQKYEKALSEKRHEAFELQSLAVLPK
ncbi:MAG: C39 family peptidase [Ruminococcus sp.]|nr:C39 family peptidase [Ruminococcus sp.]